MKKLPSCEFNMDTACVELKYSDRSMIAIIAPLWRTRLPAICMNGQSLTILSTTHRLNMPTSF